MKYQIGDRVIVRDDLDLEHFKMYFMEDYNLTGKNLMGWSLNIVAGMRKYFGEEVEIVGIWDEDSALEGAYIISHPVYGEEGYGWTDEMFASLAEESVEYPVVSLEELL